MSRRQMILLGAALALLIGLAALAGSPGGARGSAVSHGAGGWLAARRYLEARGVEVALLDRPLSRFEEPGVLVVTFPWQAGSPAEVGVELDRHLRRGGDVVLAYSGELSRSADELALDGVGLEPGELRRAPLLPWRWRGFVREEWELVPAAGLGAAARPLRVWAPRWLPTGHPEDAEVLYTAPGGEPAVVAYERNAGRVVVLPVDVFSNARLGTGGSADLLETLVERLGGRWTFDEYHHGLVGAHTVEAVSILRVVDLVLLHLVVLYLLAVAALARRFGPAWREAPAVTGSTGSFLLGLGELHHRSGHHREAALLLLDRVREVDRDLALPAELRQRAESADAAGLVELARAVARLRQGKSV